MKTHPISGQDLLNVFDYFCKKVIRYENYKLLRSEKRKYEKEIIYVGMEQQLLDIEHTEDQYSILFFWLKIGEFAIAIEDELLYRSLLLLPEKKLVIIVSSYFRDMTDEEISKEMLLPKSTVQYNRVSALKRIKKLMEGF